MWRHSGRMIEFGPGLRHGYRMTRPGFTFSHRLRVRYAEIDGQKVVFNSRYLEYADVALSEYWRWLALAELPEWRTMEFHVARATVDYKAPFRYDDVFDAHVRTGRIGTSSVTSLIELVHADTGALHTMIELVHVNVDLDAGRSAPIPAAVRARMLPTG
jgi:acyl-CoA thioester hydrolase